MMLLWGAITCRRGSGSWARRTPAPAVPRSPVTAILAPSFLPMWGQVWGSGDQGQQRTRDFL